MIRHKAAKRYAKAAFELARDKGELDALLPDLRALARLIKESTEFAAFVGNDLIPSDRRAALIADLFEERLHPGGYRFIQYLERKKRLGLLDEICACVEELADEHEGLLKARITSAFPLAPQQRDQIVERLARKHDRRIEAQTAIDRSLIGGFRIQLGDMIEDYSLKNQLGALQRNVVRG